MDGSRSAGGGGRIVNYAMYRTGCLAPATREFYRSTLRHLDEYGIPVLVGGADALERYTGIERHTKDFDIFVRRRDVQALLQELAARGYRTELSFSHWLGKAFCNEDFIDVIFSSGNGVAQVDDEWFAYAHRARVLGYPALLCPPEEIIWSKSYVMERERFDGADIVHLLRARGADLDWKRLLRRFGAHWPVLMSHLLLFDFVYPSERRQIPQWVRESLGQRMMERPSSDTARTEAICYGTLLSREQYLIDIERWGYQDGRAHEGTMSPKEVAAWTAAIEPRC